MKRLLIVFLAILLLPTVCWGRTPNDFHQNTEAKFSRPEKDGFFFYRDNLEEARPAAEERTPAEFDGKIPWDKVETMHPDEFAQLMTDMQKWSIHKAKPEYIKEYLTLQRVAVMRSENYSRVWKQVLKDNPELDPTVARPPTRIGSRIEAQIQNEQTAEVIGEMREQMGILFFTRPGCQYCVEQKNILLGFMEQWNWGNVQEINVNEFPDAAQEYGVTLVPDLFVVGNVKDTIRRQRLRAGLTTRQEIEAGLMEAYSTWFHGRSYMTPQIAEGEEAFIRFLQQQIQDATAKGQSQSPVNFGVNILKK